MGDVVPDGRFIRGGGEGRFGLACLISVVEKVRAVSAAPKRGRPLIRIYGLLSQC